MLVPCGNVLDYGSLHVTGDLLRFLFLGTEYVVFQYSAKVVQSLGRSGVFPGGELQGGLVVCKTQYVGFYSMRFSRSCPVAVYGYENVGLSFSRYGGAFLKRDEPVAVSCKVDVFYAETLSPLQQAFA